MATLNEPSRSTLNLSREEQWVLHHVMLDRIELELHAPETTDPPSIAVYRVFEKLENGIHRFSQRERQCIKEELQQYADAAETPSQDRPIADRILTQLR